MILGGCAFVGCTCNNGAAQSEVNNVDSVVDTVNTDSVVVYSE